MKPFQKYFLPTFKKCLSKVRQIVRGSESEFPCHPSYNSIIITRHQAGCGSGQRGLVVGDPAHSRGGWNSMTIVVLFNPGHSMILWYVPTFLLSWAKEQVLRAATGSINSETETALSADCNITLLLSWSEHPEHKNSTLSPPHPDVFYTKEQKSMQDCRRRSLWKVEQHHQAKLLTLFWQGERFV